MASFTGRASPISPVPGLAGIASSYSPVLGMASGQDPQMACRVIHQLLRVLLADGSPWRFWQHIGVVLLFFPKQRHKKAIQSCTNSWSNYMLIKCHTLLMLNYTLLYAFVVFFLLWLTTKVSFNKILFGNHLTLMI